jgi:hypothetical protein
VEAKQDSMKSLPKKKPAGENLPPAMICGLLRPA